MLTHKQIANVCLKFKVHFLQQMEIVLGSKIKKTIIEHPDFYPSDEPVRRCPDLKKASTHLAYQPTVSLSEGLRRSINWAAEHYISKL